jgi:thioesterase domain-containing protein/acyl carrier protein
VKPNGTSSDSCPGDGRRATPSRAAEQFLAAIWAEALGVEQVGPKDNFFDLGGDSISAARVLAAVEASFGKRLPMAALFQFPTVAQMAETLRGVGATNRHPSLVLIQAGDGRSPLFYAPGATAGNTVLLGYSAYLPRLARRLGRDQTVYSLYQEYSGPATTVETVAANLVRDIRSVQPNGPYHLGGWSLGGLVVFEMARQLACVGEEVALLALFDTTGPGDAWRKTRMGRIATALRAWLDLPPAEKLVHPTAGIRGLIYRVNRRIRGRVERLIAPKPDDNPWRRAAQLGGSYVSTARPYHGRLTLFVSDETTAAAMDDVALRSDPHLGWSAMAGAVEVHKLPGDHYTMFDEPGLTTMTNALLARLPAGRVRAGNIGDTPVR